MTGVRLADGELVPAAVVVDTTGRRSRAPAWLAALGVPAPEERSVETGIFYYTRFYRLRRGRPPGGGTGLVAGDLGWVKIAVFPGDADTFSITVGTPVDDHALKALSRPRQFERFVAALPAIAPWRARGVSAPISGPDTPVLVMGELRNRLRRFVDRDGPLLPGFFALGDAAYHTNPIYGRGCPTALVHATLLDEALGQHPDDLRAAARCLDRQAEIELRPFWDAAVAADRRALGDPRDGPRPRRARHSCASPSRPSAGSSSMASCRPRRWIPVVFRGLLRIFHMLDAPDRLVRDPEIVLRSLPVLARSLWGAVPAKAFPPVTRDEVVAQLLPVPTRDILSP